MIISKSNHMNDWNEQAIRESFINRYQDSVRYCKEIKYGKLLKTDTYKNIYDERWARCFVFDYLQVSSCLKSREQLLIELNLMIDRKITPFGACMAKYLRNMESI